jgi:hypothetical protein
MKYRIGQALAIGIVIALLLVCGAIGAAWDAVRLCRITTLNAVKSSEPPNQITHINQ